MADSTISNLPLVTPLTVSDVLPVDHGGATFKATVSQVIALAVAQILSTAQSWTAAQRGAYQALTSSSGSIAVNLALSNNFNHTLTENTTLAAPSNVVAGQGGVIEFAQHASAAKTLAYNSFWKWAGGTSGVISATVGSKNVLAYVVDSSGTFATCTLQAAVS